MRKNLFNPAIFADFLLLPSDSFFTTYTNYFPYYNKISVDVRVNYSLTTTLLWY